MTRPCHIVSPFGTLRFSGCEHFSLTKRSTKEPTCEIRSGNGPQMDNSLKKQRIQKALEFRALLEKSIFAMYLPWPANGQQMARKWTAGGQQVVPYNKDKKEKKDNNYGE